MVMVRRHERNACRRDLPREMAPGHFSQREANPRTSRQQTGPWHELLDPGTRTALLLFAGIAAQLLLT